MTIDEPGHEAARPDDLAAVECLPDGRQSGRVIGQIANGSHSGGDLQQPVLQRQVGVHVPKPGEQVKALAVYYPGFVFVTGRDDQSRFVPDFDDTAAPNRHVPSTFQCAALHVHHGDVAQDPVGGQFLGQAFRQPPMIGFFITVLDFLQPGQNLLHAPRHQAHPA